LGAAPQSAPERGRALPRPPLLVRLLQTWPARRASALLQTWLARLALLIGVVLLLLPLAGIALTVWPFADWTLPEKLSFLELSVGIVGFAVTTSALVLAIADFERAQGRPNLELVLVRPPQPPIWTITWRVINRGQAPCQWFALYLTLAAGAPGIRERVRILQWPATASVGISGRWIRPASMTGDDYWLPNPSPIGFQSDGSTVLFDELGEELVGPTLGLDALTRPFYVTVFVRAQYGKPKYHSYWVNPRTGQIKTSGAVSPKSFPDRFQPREIAIPPELH
jgi:hypothetical protein